MREMSTVKISASSAIQLFLFLIVFLGLLPRIWCVSEEDYRQSGNAALLPLVTQAIYNDLTNLKTALTEPIMKNLKFCIKDVNVDWKEAFDFKGNLDFLASCIKTTKGEVKKRLCTTAEIKFYFSSIVLQTDPTKPSKELNILKPNQNCNLNSWVPGCEPGWGCRIDSHGNITLKTSSIPSRVQDCQPCCAGFFCPEGLTCMIPCPLGSHCPLGKLNKTTGNCDPYKYQVPPGQQNHSCGGADLWVDVKGSSEFFCEAGSYCPTTTSKLVCPSGSYCRAGSTSHTPCIKLTSCKKNSATQNIHLYGIISIALLSTLLVIIYNCSDQVLTTRERRQAKKREAAARHARETAQARERWKAAKNIAKKSRLQEQLSRTFSRRKSAKQGDQSKGLDQAKPDAGATLLRPLPPSASGGSDQSSTASKAKKKESDITKVLQSLEDDFHTHEGFDLKIGDKNIKKQAPRGKQLHTQSQIFKYAYGQLEKEKQQQNKDLTFSGVISMATDSSIKTRPVIEVVFKDLTITLKRKNRHLLRCVTGKIMPGRVSAVMGPSGAGKTTFLSALAGKTTGCTMSGLVLINGKAESIDSYKKIIGFVPQDDIVHGNLTVEENLRFSARCRLSADMPKPDKVLVVERVIESLGLQAVRDSLVGTVEKRGISGGQRKRVNVGIEMVMEPSLLILDEPTTGLDSASSQLLLKALRREALEGVNICMVVHQPSYALFRMFDDFILLAKGGLTVYHGAVKKVEEYFVGIGITVPDRVNPPDHFIDILEGIVKPSSGVTHEQLPVRWMLHNGYPVPPDMLKYCDEIGGSSSGSKTNDETDPNDTGSSQHSLVGELWQDVKSSAQAKGDHLQRNFLSSKDLSNRRTPGVYKQFRYFVGRVAKQRLRDSRIQAVDYLLLLLAGACLGTLAKVNDETFGSLGYTYTVIAVSLLCKIAALRSFSLDKLQYWRESAAGISSLAHFLSKDTVDHFNTLIKPLVYLSMFYFMSNPRSSFGDHYIVLACLVYCVTGIAYGLAIYLQPGPAQLCAVLLPVVLTLIANQDKDSFFVKYLGKLCYTKWALEGFVIANARRYSGIWLITRCGSLMTSGYDLHNWALCSIVLVLMGLLSRAIAFFLMVTFQKK